MAQDFAKALYSSTAWIRLRRNLIIERGPICERCRKIISDTSKLIGHHTITLNPENVHDVAITLNPDFIELVCLNCHNNEPNHFSGKTQQHKVYIIYGSPFAGKETLVNQMREYGDLIVSMDRLFECISMQPSKPNNLRFNVFVMRDKLIDMIKTRYGKWKDAYIIGGYANKQEREFLAKDIGAELIYCESTRVECMQRAPDEQKQWVDKWWNAYEE